MGVRGGDQASEASGARAEGPWSSLRPTANRIAGRDPVRAEQPYPHGPLAKFLQSGDIADAGAEISKLYVAITRARQSVGFVVPDGSPLKAMSVYRPDTAGESRRGNDPYSAHG